MDQWCLAAATPHPTTLSWPTELEGEAQGRGMRSIQLDALGSHLPCSSHMGWSRHIQWSASLASPRLCLPLMLLPCLHLEGPVAEPLLPYTFPHAHKLERLPSTGILEMIRGHPMSLWPGSPHPGMQTCVFLLCTYAPARIRFTRPKRLQAGP